jgi:small GTP-binding protein
MIRLKCILIGDSGVGKSSILYSYIKNNVNMMSYSPTIGVEFGSKLVEMDKLISNEDLSNYQKRFKTVAIPPVKFQIWDTSGQERFHSIVKSYYRGIHTVIFVCDLTKKVSFNNLEQWIDSFKNNTTRPEDDVVKIIIANKSDLKNDYQCDLDEIAKYARNKNIKLYITTIHDQDVIKSIFNEIALMTFKKYITLEHDETENAVLFNVSSPPPKRYCYC